MKSYERYIKTLYERRIENEFDAVLLVIGGEGKGKSTLILETALIYQEARDGERSPEDLFDRLVFSRSDMKRAWSRGDRRDLVLVPDAARVFHKKETMHGDQVELEKDFLDVRTKEYFVILGYQDWGDVPTFLQERRAHGAVYIPTRGSLRGFSRASLDEKVDGNYAREEWPAADLAEKFPSLEGTDLWEEYKRLDTEEKEKRMGGEEEVDERDIVKREHTKVALRAVRPWDPGEGMTYREAARLTEFSATWVHYRVEEWHEGYHRELFDEEELEAIRAIESTPS